MYHTHLWGQLHLMIIIHCASLLFKEITYRVSDSGGLNRLIFDLPEGPVNTLTGGSLIAGGQTKIHTRNFALFFTQPNVGVDTNGSSDGAQPHLTPGCFCFDCVQTILSVSMITLMPANHQSRTKVICLLFHVVHRLGLLHNKRAGIGKGSPIFVGPVVWIVSHFLRFLPWLWADDCLEEQPILKIERQQHSCGRLWILCRACTTWPPV